MDLLFGGIFGVELVVRASHVLHPRPLARELHLARGHQVVIAPRRCLRLLQRLSGAVTNDSGEHILRGRRLDNMHNTALLQ